MNRYVIDSSAWIEYFLASAQGEKVKSIVEESLNQCFTSSLSIAEVVIKLKRANLDYYTATETIRRLSQILPVEEETALEAGVLYVEKRKKMKDIGIVDVIIMVKARDNALIVVTKDKNHFHGEEGAVLL